MKKTLIALAALAATGAFAQNVAITGNLDNSLYNQGSTSTGANAWTHNSNSTSLINLAGSEDLGGGMKAGFSLTSELQIMAGQIGSTSTGASTAATGQTVDIFNRGANVSLSSGMGTLTIGRQTDLWFATQGSVNTSGSNSYGFGNLTSVVSNGAAISKLMGATPATAVAADYAVNGANSTNSGTAPFVFASGVGYTSPSFSGVQVGIQSLNSNYANGGNRNGTAMNITYGNGPLKLAAATSSRNDATGASAAWVNTVYGGSYTMGAHTFIVGINKTSFSGAYAAADNMTATGLGWNYVVSPAVDMNVAYGTLVDDTNSTNKATQLGVTARYKLSARTQVYAGIGNVKNEGASLVGSIYAGGGVADKDATTSSYMLGLKHTF